MLLEVLNSFLLLWEDKIKDIDVYFCARNNSTPNIMSDFHIYIKMPSYLRQWFIHRHSGTDPVPLNNGSIESKLIKQAVVRPPETVIPHRQQEDSTCWDSIAKNYQRLRKNYLTNQCKRKKSTTKSRRMAESETSETHRHCRETIPCHQDRGFDRQS